MLNVRWYLSNKMSYRDFEEMAAERGLEVDHTTIYRWVMKFSPELEKAVSRLKRSVGKSWRLHETYVKVKGQWKYLYRAVDKEGNTVDYRLCCVARKTSSNPECRFVWIFHLESCRTRGLVSLKIPDLHVKKPAP